MNAAWIYCYKFSKEKFLCIQRESYLNHISLNYILLSYKDIATDKSRCFYFQDRIVCNLVGVNHYFLSVTFFNFYVTKSSIKQSGFSNMKTNFEDKKCLKQVFFYHIL